jgi:ABC-type proline/glycine betaine transport system permease subunit
MIVCIVAILCIITRLVAYLTGIASAAIFAAAAMGYTTYTVFFEMVLTFIVSYIVCYIVHIIFEVINN